MSKRVQTGVPGLDEMLHGGFLEGSAVLVQGAPGTGKTTLGLQFLHTGIVKEDEPGLLITFEEFPYSLLRRWIGQSGYLMTYFHPRDFDPDQPKVPELSLLRRFKSYYGLTSAADKLTRMVEEFRFQPLSQAVAEIDWTKARVIRL